MHDRRRSSSSSSSSNSSSSIHVILSSLPYAPRRGPQRAAGAAGAGRGAGRGRRAGLDAKELSRADGGRDAVLRGLARDSLAAAPFCSQSSSSPPRVPPPGTNSEEGSAAKVTPSANPSSNPPFPTDCYKGTHLDHAAVQGFAPVAPSTVVRAPDSSLSTR